MELGEHKDKLLNETFLLRWVGFFCACLVFVSSRKGGWRREEGRPLPLSCLLRAQMSLKFYFFTLSSPPPPPQPTSLFPCPSFPLGRQPCALEALRDETADWSCSRGVEEEEGSRKSLAGAAAKTPASNRTGCGETVKLLKQLQQNLRRRKTERESRIFPHCVAKQNGIRKRIDDFVLSHQ